mgnify:CR=1 FL=1
MTGVQTCALPICGATGLSKTSLVAWYDFGDATDAHASYDLTEDNSPSYTSGPPNYGSATAASSQQWHTTATTGMTSVWAPDTATDITLVIRFKIGASVTNGNYVFNTIDTRYALRHLTSTGCTAYLNNVSPQTSTVLATGTWYLLIAQMDAATHTTHVWINNSDQSSTSGSASASVTALYLGGISGGAEDVDIDYAGFFNRLLTSDERTWLYNSGGTRTYAELD